MSKTLSIDKIVADDSIQIRVGVSSSRVDELVEIYQDLPDWKVVHTPEDHFILADGYHRRAAAKRKGLKTAECEIIEGDYRRALEIAVESNCRGPLNLTRQEKQNTAEKMLKYFPERANSWIAELIGISMQTVEKVRVQMEDTKTIPVLEEFETRDGRSYPRKIMKSIETNLGKEDEERSEGPTRDEIISSLMSSSRRPPSQSEIPPPPKREELFTGDYAKKRHGKIAKTAEESVKMSEGLFIEDPDFKGTPIGVAISGDGNKSIRILCNDSNVNIVIYEFKGEKFFPESNVELAVDDFYEFMGLIQLD